MLDASPSRAAGDLWVRDARVLVGLAKEILAVDELERTLPTQLLEAQPETLELIVRSFRHHADDLRLRQAGRVCEAFGDPAASAGACHDEVHLGKVGQRAVVQVNRELESEEASERRVAQQEIVDALERRGGRDLPWSPISHHPVEELQVVRMLPLLAERWRRHDVRRRVEALPSGHRLVEDSLIRRELEALPRRALAKPSGEQLPGVDAVEYLEEEDPKEDLLDVLGAVVDHVADQVLAHPVRGPVGIGEAMTGDDRVVGPWPRQSAGPLRKDLLARYGEAPVGVEDRGDLQLPPAAYSEHSRRYCGFHMGLVPSGKLLVIYALSQNH